MVEDSTKVIRSASDRVDQTLAALEGKTSDISDSAQQLSQNVTDKGLVLVVLPEEKEQELIETAGSVKDTYSGIREFDLPGSGSVSLHQSHAICQPAWPER